MRVDDEVVVGAPLVDARVVTDPGANAAAEELLNEWPEIRFVFGMQFSIYLRRIGQRLAAGIFRGFDRNAVERGKAVKVPFVEPRDPAGKASGRECPRVLHVVPEKNF